MIIFLVFTFWKHKVFSKYGLQVLSSRRETIAGLCAAAGIPEPGAGNRGAHARHRLDGSLGDDRAVRYYTKGGTSFLTPAGCLLLLGSRGDFVTQY